LPKGKEVPSKIFVQARHWWLTPIILATSEAEMGRIKYFMGPYLENTQHKKKTGGVTQVVEQLPSKCEALSTNSLLQKKNLLKKN
jgi:hypothetical protein